MESTNSMRPACPQSVVGDAASTNPATRSGWSMATLRTTRHEPRVPCQHGALETQGIEKRRYIGGEVLYPITGRRLVQVAVAAL